jgi:hypothetical protein
MIRRRVIYHISFSSFLPRGSTLYVVVVFYIGEPWSFISELGIGTTATPCSHNCRSRFKASPEAMVCCLILPISPHKLRDKQTLQ